MNVLREAINTTPIIDHHAHNLLLPQEQDKHPFLSITTEATGAALDHAPSTLAHMRAVRQLAVALECASNWETIMSCLKTKRTTEYEAWAQKCFSGIETVLVDDGLDQDIVHPYRWHDRLTRSPCKRIVRIEKVAEGILMALYERDRKLISSRGLDMSKFLADLIDQFSTAILDAISDTNIVGFKSVICYRTGLAIPEIPELEDVSAAMQSILKHERTVEELNRVEDKVLSPFLVHVAARLIEESSTKKPLQFHTGLGDNDIRLRFSSPSHLQPFIEMYPNLPVVLLHASYPFTKEAGYLASTYKNVYLDIGEVFPMLSQEGQENVLREALELCPSEKLTWSTDGHWFPETYMLAVIQVREALEHVLFEYVDRGILRLNQAVDLVQDILFKTSNRLYKLDLPMKLLGPSTSSEVGPPKSTIPELGRLEKFMEFVQDPGHYINNILLQWLDYTSTVRVRLLPKKQAIERFKEGNLVGITKAVLGLLQQDEMSPGFTAIGEYSLYPCFDSLQMAAQSGNVVVHCEFREKNGDQVPICPRTVLRTVIEKAAAHGVSFLIGFEIEVVFMDRQIVDGHFQYGEVPISQGHTWSAARAFQDRTIKSFVDQILKDVSDAGIEVEQFHPESAPGQWEFVLSPLPPLQAVDTLLVAREIISTNAYNWGLRATLVPKAYPTGAGSGAHVHISMESPALYEMLYAGVLQHLRAIVAFTYPNAASYERAGDSVWAGGRWVTYGTQNREAPLRKIEESHWELKCMDGLANPYLALAAILGSGLQGILDKEPLTIKDCQKDPAHLTEQERDELGISERLPMSIGEALTCLREDAQLRDILGGEVVDTYLTVKTAEGEMLQRMDAERRRHWLIERY